MPQKTLSFAEIGEIFNDATQKLVGGIDDHNRGRILDDLNRVQTQLGSAIQQAPGDFQGVAGVHAQNIVDQINLEKQAIASVGTDPFAAKYINDVQRDLIDIVQGDDQLHGLATAGGHNGFGAVPQLLAPPAPFKDSPQQTTFLQGFVQGSQDFAARATAAVQPGADPAAVKQLVSDIQAFANNADTFSRSQTGLYSARFNNELASDGVAGTAVRAIVDGLANGNKDKVLAGAEVLSANAGDVAQNMAAAGQPAQASGSAIPDKITTLAEAGAVFNDSTAKLIGGLYDGNKASVHDDLTATRKSIADMLSGGQFQGQQQADAMKLVKLLDKELKLVDDQTPGPHAPTEINKVHTKIIDVVQKDAGLAAAADTGFAKLPGMSAGGPVVADGQSGHDGVGGQHGQGHDQGAGGGHAGVGHDVAANDPLAHIFAAHHDSHGIG